MNKTRQKGYGYKNLLADVAQENYAPIYLFLGEEGFLANNGILALKRALLSPDEESWNLAEFHGKESNGDELVAFLCTLPIVGSRRVAIIHDFDQWKVADTESLFPLLEDMPDYAHLIARARSIDRRTKFYRFAQARGQIVDVSPLDAPEAAAWLMDRGRELGLRFSPRVARAMVDQVGLSLWQLDKELEKLACYKDPDDTVVTEADVAALVITGREVADNTIFKFTDAVAVGDRKGAMALLQELLLSGREPLSILTMIARQLRIIAFAVEGARVGISFQEISRELKVPGFVVQRALSQGQRMGATGIRGALLATFQADREIKSGFHEPGNALELLVVRLTASIDETHRR